MKTLSPAVTSLLTKTHGLEPVNIFAVQWVKDGATYYYADKDITEGSTFIPGSILEVGTLESIVKYESRGQSQAISIKLSDIDGVLKDIFNNHDIHARPAKIYQWFDGLPLSEKFLLFEGEISSNIQWSEGDRVLTLDVITKLYATEAGFSPEEGYFSYIPSDLIGKAWPLVFGTVQNVPVVRIVNVPQGQTASAIGVPDPDIPNKLRQISETIGYLESSQWFYIYAALQCATTESQYIWDYQRWFNYATECNTAYQNANLAAASAGTEAEKRYWQAVAEWWRKEGEAALSMSSKCASAAGQAASTKDSMESNQASVASNLAQARADYATLIKEYLEQQQYTADEIEIIGGKVFPQNKQLTVDIEGVEYTGVFNGDTLKIQKVTLPNFVSDLTRPFGFTFIQTGGKVTIKTEKRIVYIANILPTEIINVKAWRRPTTNGAEVLTFVPVNWYSVQNINLVGYTVTAIIFEKPLSSFDESFNDDIYVTMKSPVGPNTVDIMRWLIETYTDLDIDEVSFAHVKEKLENYPSHFALLERKNVLELLEDIAFQCRCSIWLSNRKFYLKYLSEEYDATGEITENDIDAGTLTISTTSSEDIVTRYVAKWTDNYANETKHSIVLRHNVSKYGLREKEYEYFIYNIFNLVLKSATFWMIRYANVWKKIKFDTYINKLAIDTFDTVNFNLVPGLIANDEICGQVDSLVYNSADKSIAIEAWLPIRIGEMVQYPFSLPAEIPEYTVFPSQADVESAYPGGTIPGINVTGDSLINSEDLQSYYSSDAISSNEIHVGRLDWGNKYPSDLHQKTKPEPDFEKAGHAGVAHDPNYPEYRTYVPTLTAAEPIVPPEKVKNEPTKWEYPAQCFPGKILSGGGDEYVVEVYQSGLSREPIIATVRQLQIDMGENIPADTWVIVSVVYVEKNDGSVTYYEPEYNMQVPVWL